MLVPDNVNGNPQGKIYWPIATTLFDSTDGVVHESDVVELRDSISENKDFQSKTNKKFGLQLAEGGDISYDNASSTVAWSADLKIVNPY